MEIERNPKVNSNMASATRKNKGKARQRRQRENKSELSEENVERAERLEAIRRKRKEAAEVVKRDLEDKLARRTALKKSEAKQKARTEARTIRELTKSPGEKQMTKVSF